MFRLDLTAIQEAAIEARITANPANAAIPPSKQSKEDRHPPSTLATLATLATAPHLVAYIDPAVPELISAAMRACDVWNDSTEAREQMRRECAETPPHLRADLLDHFRKTYPCPNQLNHKTQKS